MRNACILCVFVCDGTFLAGDPSHVHVSKIPHIIFVPIFVRVVNFVWFGLATEYNIQSHKQCHVLMYHQIRAIANAAQATRFLLFWVVHSIQTFRGT